MKARSKRVLNMMVVVSDFLSLQAAVFGSIPGLTDVITAFSAKVLSLVALRRTLADAPSAGSAKSALRKTLEALVIRNSRRLSAYASIKKLADLKKQIRFTRSVILKMGAEDLLDAARLLHEKAAPLLSELAGFKITAATQTELKTASDAFELSIPKSREEVTAHSSSLETMESELSESLDLLEVIDEAAGVVAEDNPEIAQTYFKNRKVLSPPSHPVALKGTILNSATGEALYHVVVTINNQQVKTTKKGNFRVPSLPPGTYTASFSKPGFSPVEMAVIIGSAGETVTLNLNLVPLP